MNIHILESKDWAKCAIGKAEISKWIAEAAEEASDLLIDIMPTLNIIVKPNLPHVSSNKGVGGSTYDHELVDITFDTAIPFGADKLQKYLREAVFHEMNHAMYSRFYPREGRQLYWTILEGLGTVFDRDYADGEHFTEVDMASDLEKREWLNKYIVTSTRYNDVPDDSRGMVYQVGVWLVDRAMKNSGKNVVELTHLSPDEILELADIG